MSDYPAPVDKLLSFGERDFGDDWPDYVADLGLRAEHVPDLIRMIGDEDLYEDDGDPSAYWATIHARRALGQLQAVEAVGPLLAAMDEFGDLDDYWPEELPDILARIGPRAVPAIGQRLSEKRPGEYTRIACSSALEKIGNAFPEARDECIARLTEHLATREDDEDSWALNGFVANDLVDLKAVESASVIEAAFAADVVDESIAGGWQTARHGLGLGPAPSGHDIRPQWRLTFDRPAKARPNLDKLRKKKKKAEKRARNRGRKSR